jgi:hypothetical protein
METLRYSEIHVDWLAAFSAMLHRDSKDFFDWINRCPNDVVQG